MFARFFVAGGLEEPILEAALDALDFGLHLLEGCALVGGVALGLAALLAEEFEAGG